MESRQELEYELSDARVEYSEALRRITEIKKKLALLAFVNSEKDNDRPPSSDT